MDAFFILKLLTKNLFIVIFLNFTHKKSPIDDYRAFCFERNFYPKVNFSCEICSFRIFKAPKIKLYTDCGLMFIAFEI